MSRETSYVERPSWQRDALCRERDLPVDFFFPSTSAIAAARAVCALCPVREKCLQYALDAGPELCGIWAGTTERQRARLRRVARSHLAGISRLEPIAVPHQEAPPRAS